MNEINEQHTIFLSKKKKPTLSRLKKHKMLFELSNAFESPNQQQAYIEHPHLFTYICHTFIVLIIYIDDLVDQVHKIIFQ